MRPPKSFTQVEGWRESFESAAKKQELIRASSLFPEVPQTLCGEDVRAVTLADWTLLATMARSPFFVGGFPEVKHASNVIWVLRRKWLKVGHGWFSKLLRRGLMAVLLVRFRGNTERIVNEVSSFLDDAFIDMPGVFSPDDGKKRGLNPVRMPHVAAEIAFCGEVMAQFPSFKYEELRRMPIAQFWQWLHEAREARDTDYRNPQMTDLVNRNANAELNRLRREFSENNAAK